MKKLLAEFAEHGIARIQLRKVRVGTQTKTVLVARRPNKPLVHAYGYIEDGVLRPVEKSTEVDLLLRGLVLKSVNPRETAGFTWPEERIAANIVYHRAEPLEIDVRRLRRKLAKQVASTRAKQRNTVR